MSLGHRSNARKTQYNGRTYDSMLEASVARDLDILLKSRRIKAVAPQVKFDLFGKGGTKIFAHIVDFIVTCNDDVQKAVEAKGEETDIWKAKMKLFKDNYPHIEYVVVKRENVGYGPLIDLPATLRKPPPDTFAEDVAAVMQNLAANN